MPWLRVDDGFAQHPKVVQLPRGDRWTWLEVLLYCARYRTEGAVPAGISEIVRRATPKFLAQCVELRLLERSGDGFVVHDWEEYNPKDPTNAERQARLRNRRSNGKSNASDRYENEKSNGGDRYKSRVDDVTVTAPRAQAGARVPSPSPTTTPNKAEDLVLSAVGSKTTGNGLPTDKELLATQLLGEIGADQDLDTADVVRALAARLPPASLVKVRESLRENHPRNRAAYAVGALQSELSGIRHADTDL